MRVHQCDRCGAIMKAKDTRIEINFCRYEDGVYVDSESVQRDLCKKCADRLLSDASGEQVEPQPRRGLIEAARLKDRIAAASYTVKRTYSPDVLRVTYPDEDPEHGMCLHDIFRIIDMEVMDEELTRVGLRKESKENDDE